MTRIAVPAVAVLAAVASIIAVAQWNRAEPPVLVLTLTERELPMRWAQEPSEEAAVLRLPIAVQHRVEPLDARNWLPEGRLREIGFAFDVAVGSPQAAYAYDNVPARMAWVALEYDGPAWREVERRRALRAPEPARAALPTRLVPVDAAGDLERLRSRYTAGHLILRAVIGLQYVAPQNGGPFVHGTLERLVPDAIAVPPRWRHVFEPLPPREPDSAIVPRYEADIALGQWGLPYLRAARLTTAAAPERPPSAQ